ncbi:MAG TPA: nuclease [Microscillaceae bacterium]|nr:nuclease [Microscillaceae bacterium]
MKELLEMFEKTFEDQKLSSAERKALTQIIRESNLKNNQVGFLRNQVFDIARGAFKSYPALQVIDWLEQANKLLLKSNANLGDSRSNEIYFSPGDACLNAINHALSKARQTINICVFTISDNRITNNIIACHQSGIKVRVITDDDKTQDKGSDIYQMHQAGIPIRTDETPNHMHHKFAIIDNDTLITGSYNWTRSAAQYNHENIFITYDKGSLKSYQEEFDKLWKEFIDYQ